MNITPEDTKKIKAAIIEISNALYRVSDNRDLIKEIVKKTSEEYGIEKKTFAKIAKIYHKQSFEEEGAEFEEFSTLYESVITPQTNIGEE